MAHRFTAGRIVGRVRVDVKVTGPAFGDEDDCCRLECGCSRGDRGGGEWLDAARWLFVAQQAMG